MSAKIYSVDSVCFHINKSHPAQLIVHGVGKVNSSGWSGGKLIPWTYVDQPQDGILDFDFIATAPSGFVLLVISPIEGIGKIQLEDWITGIRVHSSTNKVEVLLSDTKCSVDAQTISSDVFPWPRSSMES
ncbi:hypothetical protein MHO82_12765 [Vibrio sp. Of7-15]|uniref:hypothetical protein n=1 Tax=Vibrio sp. Of7-15 TaxID=2724879 RepID=UPI001EF1AB92|nr:hypothetical protein [Vibrio sp. Of7-15]MCG7497736.1 hypothetical protein [Vibrio sp. Of7-15]